MIAISFDQLGPAVGWGILFQRLPDERIGYTEMFADGDCDQDIGQVIISYQLRMYGADSRSANELYGEEGGGGVG